MTITILCPTCRNNVGRHVIFIDAVKCIYKTIELIEEKIPQKLKNVQTEVLHALAAKDCCRTRLITYYSPYDTKHTNII